MPVPREALKWLFAAEFADGSFIEQDDEDTCFTRDDGTGSRFTDVLARDEDPIAFHLINGSSGEAVSVDLVTGAFLVNGTPVHIHEQHFDPSAHKLSLIYFREARVEQTSNMQGVVFAERHYTNRYFVGWETYVGVKHKQATLAVG